MLLTIVIMALSGIPGPQSASPETRAIAYLSEHVPGWYNENGCFSCHNNGDAARALFLARRLGFEVPDSALADTVEWLRRPAGWDENKGDPGFSDKKLARIEFAASLVEAVDAGVLDDSEAIVQAAELLVMEQESDGSWQVDIESGIATPATYGPVLGTTMARRTLERAGRPQFADPIRRAGDWLLGVNVSAVMDTAAVILALNSSTEDRVRTRVRELLGVIQNAQNSNGGWGPYANAPSEAFDTAIALLALVPFREEAGMSDRIRRGRAFLESIQLSDGGWIETTRPSGAVSYAQHISTSGWATLALLSTR